MYLTGILQALGIVILSAIFNVYIRTLSLYYDIDPIMFTLCTFISTSLVLCFFGGPGKLASNTISSPKTWIYGLALSMTVAIDIYLVKYISGTETGLVCRWAVPACSLLAFLVIKRKPSKTDWLAMATICFGAVYMIIIQKPEVRIPLIILGLILSLVLASTYIIPEIHKENAFAQESHSIHIKLRVIGLAMFSTSIVILFLLVTVITCKELFAYKFVFLNNPEIPNHLIFKDHISMIAGIVGGVMFSTPILFLKWSASYKINAETVLVVLSLIPISTLGLEYSLSFLPVLNINQPTFHDGHAQHVLYIVIIMTIGSTLSAYIKTYKKVKEVEGKTLLEKIKNSAKIESENLTIQYSRNSMADYEVVKNTVNFYEGNIRKAAKILEIPEDTIKTLLFGGNKYSLEKNTSERVHKIFRNKVFYLDQLTGIENKKGLIKNFSEFKQEAKVFQLYYLDLNKFKQINDTFGHNAGDITLIKIAHRLREYAKRNNGFAYRLSGDEFAFLTTSKKNKPTIIRELKETIAQPFSLAGGDKTISVTSSIGRANIIKDSDTKVRDLIESADEQMYKDKVSNK